MSIPGFPQTMRELSNRMKAERERLEHERELLPEERSHHFHRDEPIPDYFITELRNVAKREERIVQIWAWFFAIVVVGSLLGLCVWLLPSEFVIAISISLMLAASVDLGIVWHDRRRWPSGGTL